MIGLILAIANFEVDAHAHLIKAVEQPEEEDAMKGARFNKPYVKPIRYTILCTTIAAVLMCIKRHLVKREWIKKYIPEKLTGQ